VVNLLNPEVLIETERLDRIIKPMTPAPVFPAAPPRVGRRGGRRQEDAGVNLSSVSSTPLTTCKCDKCGNGLKHKDRTGIRKWCKRCIDIYYRKNRLTPQLAEAVIFDTVEPLYADARLENVDESIRKKLSSVEDGDDVFFYGNPGVGKTYIMAALIRRFIYEGYRCRRINFDDFCVELRSTMSPASRKTEWELIEPLKRVDKLFIDDLGLRSKQETDYAYTTLYSILNKRQERVLSTFLSSNKDLKRLEQAFDTRIASRLRAAVLIEIKGQDRRTEDRGQKI